MNLIPLKTLLLREIRRFLRIWPQTVLPAAMTSGLYFLIFGQLIGSRIGAMNGVSYMDYILPGVLLMSVINNAYTNVSSSFFSTKFQRNIEELLVAPIPPWMILTGFVGGGIMRAAVVASVTYLMSRLFSDWTPVNLPVVAGMFFLTALLFSLAGFINALFANNFDDISIVPNFILTPLVYLGGVFYSIDMLPPLWRSLSAWNPIFYMVHAFRYGFIGQADVTPALAFAVLSGLNISLIALSLILLHRGTGLKS